MIARTLLIALMAAGTCLHAQTAQPNPPPSKGQNASETNGGLKAAIYFGMKSSNYYRDQAQGDNFFGQRGFFMLETQRSWEWFKDPRVTQLFGSILLEGKQQSEYAPENSTGVLDYSRKAIKETSNYSAEVGFRQGIWGQPPGRLFFVLSATFRNVSLRDEPVSGGASDPAASYSDRSRATYKLGLQIRTEDPKDGFYGSFLETAFLNDEYYEQAQKRFLLRGRLAVQLDWMTSFFKGGTSGVTGGYYLEGAINKHLKGTVVQEKDESIIIVGLQFHF